MPEPLYEAERAAWIKGRRWWDRHAAMRRADLLARAARKRERAATGVGDSALHEEITKGRFAQWTHHDDTKTSALGAIAYVMLFCYALPLVVGVAWVVSHVSYLLWRTVLRPYASCPWPPLLLAAVLAVAAVMARRLGLDLVLIYSLAAMYEEASGGLLAPAALSRWYAAGTVSFLEIQVILGLLWSVYRAWSWAWVAPTVRRATATAKSRDGRAVDTSVRILGGAAAAVPAATEIDEDAEPALEDAGFQIIPDLPSEPEPEADDPDPVFDDDPFDIDDIDIEAVAQIIPTVTTTTEKELS
ncbi:hypothetical protein DEO23_15635 [Brachybacterium endophyticum]|uniref:Transmembrane protein n=1 Tax=Brachybacterium endophyticum TaxID=2182385 RepID=A0A2U2RGG8_9MICO|nr:hypothetical protein [Brachybacterium endophyticum]PWH04963.1 hypothetical protein DEO23_15635 [Brachybacterium endophyticum]